MQKALFFIFYFLESLVDFVYVLFIILLIGCLLFLSQVESTDSITYLGKSRSTIFNYFYYYVDDNDDDDDDDDEDDESVDMR